MSKTTNIIIGSAIVAGVGGFLTYRYFTFGKGNKGFICPTTFGWPDYDKKCLAEQGITLGYTNRKRKRNFIY